MLVTLVKQPGTKVKLRQVLARSFRTSSAVLPKHGGARPTVAHTVPCGQLWHSEPEKQPAALKHESPGPHGRQA
jgi:hypothetical protein